MDDGRQSIAIGHLSDSGDLKNEVMESDKNTFLRLNTNN